MLPKKITAIEWLEPEDDVWALERVSYKEPKKALKEFAKELNKNSDDPDDPNPYTVNGQTIYFWNDPIYQAYSIEISE